MREIYKLEKKNKELERKIRDLTVKLSRISTGRYVRGGNIYSVGGVVRLTGATADPAYVDGHVILYFFSSAGVDELRARGKIGAVETEVTLADFSP